jgi:radical SAM protein with 4Fe4S-binding SPASM domain
LSSFGGRIDGTVDDWSRLRAFLRVVECELNTACNRSCSYCPQAVGLVPADNRRMPPAVLDALLGDLARIDFVGRFSHHLYGEPLLDEALPNDVRRIRAELPRAVQVLFTNGDLLDDEKHAALVDAGISLFVVTRHSVGPYPERKQQVVQYAKQLQFTSRGGSIRFLAKRHPLERFRATPCFAPTEMAVVSWDGRILRCYEDARREEPFGDLRTHTLAAIWAASEPKRTALARGDRRAAGGACSTCDNANHGSPGKSVGTESFWDTDPEAVAVAAKALHGLR